MVFELAVGMNRRLLVPKNTAESTGRLPPTPILHTAANDVKVTKLGEPPAAIAKTAVMKSVILKDSLSIKWV